jgi:glycerol uptake facilitator-like aquaporin
MTAESVPRRPAGAYSRDWEGDYDEPSIVSRALARMRPDEGWSSLGLVLVLAGVMAWSIADARWILGRDDLTSFLIWVALAAVLWGYVSSRLGLPPWLAQTLGAVIGAFVVIEVVGSVLPGAKPGLVGWFQATASSVAQAYLDLTWRHQQATTQFGHFCLVIGIIVWGTAQAASYDVFGYHRAVNGILLLAAVMLANMVITYNDQFVGLVLFSAVALALLTQAHAADERSGWQRHRIWHGGDYTSPRSQGGMVFASMAIAGALVLTTVASSAPLASALPGLNDSLHDFEVWIANYLPSGGQTRIPAGADFGSAKTISSTFHGNNDLVATISLPDTGTESHWRVVAYDSFRVNGWQVTPGPPQTEIPAGSLINADTFDQVTAGTAGRVEFTYTVHIKDRTLKHAIIASEPETASISLTRILTGSTTAEGDVVWFVTGATDYTVTSLIPDLNPSGAGLTQWRLRHAGTDFNTELLARYTQGGNVVGADGNALLIEILAWAKGQGYEMDPKTGRFANEYDAASAIQTYMQDPTHFTYDSNVTDLISTCQGMSTVDCFAKYRRGFCEQYATTMTMLMRMQGYPARYVEGYLAGHLDQATRQEQLTGQQRHAWTEVYFPSYGWIPFDPTGSVGQPTLLPAGQPVAATPTPAASSSVGPGSSGGLPRRTVFEPPDHPTSNSQSGGSGLLLPLVVTGGGGAALLLVFLMFRPRRPPRNVDSVYQSVVRLASRLGYKPSPTQTVYEYTGMLAEVVPKAREPLTEVATAQVETVYGLRSPSPERLLSLSQARRAVRGALLRLLFRLPWRRPKPRR